jgi:hypothetical protein
MIVKTTQDVWYYKAQIPREVDVTVQLSAATNEHV